MEKRRDTIRARSEVVDRHLAGSGWPGWVVWSVVASGVASLPEVLYSWSLADVHRQYWVTALARAMES